MHAAKCQPCGETYIGLVEVGVGVIPAGGGCKELMVRLTEGLPDGVIDAGLNLQQLYAKAFENIAMAKVATSAVEGMELGYIRKTESISLNRDQQLWDAKQVVLGLAKFYKKPKPVMIPVMVRISEEWPKRSFTTCAMGNLPRIMIAMSLGRWPISFPEATAPKGPW